MIWCVEDDASIRDIELYALRSAGLEAEGFTDGAAFWKALQSEKPDLVVLDVMLPGIDGTELLGRMRASTSLRRIPVIMATAKGAEYDRVRALDGGADDYLTKPFSVIELVSRVKAVLRRCQPEGDSSILRSGEVSLDTRAHTVLSGGERVDLTYKEYELLRLFHLINTYGQSILMVTHSVKAASHAGRVLFIKDGEVFHQLYRGDCNNEQFYQRISDTLTMLQSGGEPA